MCLNSNTSSVFAPFFTFFLFPTPRVKYSRPDTFKLVFSFFNPSPHHVIYRNHTSNTYKFSIIYLIYLHQLPISSVAWVFKLTWALKFVSSFMLVTSDISVLDILWNKPSNYSNCCYCRIGVSKNCFKTTAHIHSAIWYTFIIKTGIGTKTAWKSNKILKARVRFFYQIFIFSSNDKPSKTIKNIFHFI